MPYHASREAGLSILEPRVQTHSKAFVYAIRNRIIAVCFGAPKDDFDLLMDEVDGIPHLYECYPHATEAVYRGRSCSLYAVSEGGFLSGATGWDAELVCESTVPVIQEGYIGDILSFLMSAVAQGTCVIHRYSEGRQYQSMLREGLGEGISRFGPNREEF